jgi:4-amino-4-deoxy-L-arabinose transferase-like glycosyltransferase
MTTRPLVFILLLTLTARVIFLLVFGGFDQAIHDSMADQNIYIDIARNLANGHGFTVSSSIWVANVGAPTSIVPPLYPLFLAGVFKIFGENLIIVRLLHVLLSLVTVAVVYILGDSMFNRRTAVIAATLCAIYPALVMYVRPIMSESLFFALVALLILTTYYLSLPSPPNWLFAAWGLLAGLAVLTRTEAALLAGLLFLYLLVIRLLKLTSTRLAVFIIPVVTFALVMLPYGFYNLSAHGTFSLSPNAKWKFWDHTWLAYNRNLPEWQGVQFPETRIVPDWESKTEAERDAYLWDMALRFVLDNPVEFLKQRAQRLLGSYPLIPREEFAPPLGTKGTVDKSADYPYGATGLDDYVYYTTPAEKLRVWLFRITAFMAVIGAFLAIRRQRYTYLLLLIVLWNIGHSMIFVGSERLRLQIDAYLILLAAVFIDWLWARVQPVTKMQTVILEK